MHRPSVVLDTNVIVSALLQPRGLEALIYRQAVGGVWAMFVTETSLKEYSQVLGREKFSFNPERMKLTLDDVRAASVVVTPVRSVAISRDSDDNAFLECAEAANAEFLITGNIRHFPRVWFGTRVIRPREFVDEILRSLQN